MKTRRTNTRALTLVECVCSITIIAFTAGTVLPVVNSATGAFIANDTARDTSEGVAYAMDRCLALLRDAPPATTGTGLNISSASASAIQFTDLRGLTLSGTTLNVIGSDNVSSPLLRDVSAFQIEYFAQNGTSSTSGTPASTWLFNVTITSSSGFSLRGCAFARVKALSP
jgi:type II secretory pathway pseudopilin PulG